jgi:hypothetical protein
MRIKTWGLGLGLMAAMCSFPLTGLAQQGASTEKTLAAPATTAGPVPQLINYAGVLTNVNGKPLSGVVGVTFLLYKDQQGGSPLWMETQNVQPDKSGHYSVMLGSSTSQGMPQDLFVSGEARWLGVQVAGEQEQPRVVLAAVPYSLKAGDAETIGGLPASAFVLANGTNGSTTSVGAGTSPGTTQGNRTPAHAPVTGRGVVNFIPMWDKTTDIVDSLIFQKSSQVGINTKAPAATFDVNGKSDIRDTLTLFPKGTDLTLAISGTAFKVDQTGKVNFVSGQTFPGTGTITGMTTASGSGLSGGGTSGTLNLSLLKTCSAHQVLQWNGSSWACSSAGSGTITGVTTASGSGLQGGGTSGTLNLSVNPALVPELGAANTFTNTNAVRVDSTANPALTLANHSGNGLTISNAGNNGIYIASTGNGIVMGSVIGDGIDIQGAAATGISAIGQNDGGYFNGRVAGSYAQNDVDGNGSAAAYGYETGSTNITYGVVGYSASNIGIGAYGQAVSASKEGGTLAGNLAIGVWGDTGVEGQVNGRELGIGVLATADNSNALLAANNAPDTYAAVFVNDNTCCSGSPVLYAGGSLGSCQVDTAGDLFCFGTKSAVVPVDGGVRKVALYAVESPENWFEDFGSGQLSNGVVTIFLEPTFQQTVNTDADYHVFLTPNGDSRGLYVAQKTATSFEVREQGGGTSSVAFDYRIVARRKGYEQIRLADKTREMNAPRPKRADGPRVVMPTQLEIRNAHEPSLHAARPAQRVVNKK